MASRNDHHDFHDCPATHYETAYPAYGPETDMHEPEVNGEGGGGFNVPFSLPRDIDLGFMFNSIQKHWAKLCVVAAVIVFLSFVIFTCESVTSNTQLIQEQGLDSGSRNLGYQTLLFTFSDMSARFVNANRTLSLSDFYVSRDNDRISIVHHKKIQIRYRSPRDFLNHQEWDEVDLHFRSVRFLAPPDKLTDNSTIWLIEEDTGIEHCLAYTKDPHRGPWMEGKVRLNFDLNNDVPIKNVYLRPDFNGIMLLVQFEVKFRGQLLFQMEYKYWEQSNRLAKQIWGPPSHY